MFSPSYCVFRHPQPGLPGTFPLPPGLDGRLAEGPRRGPALRTAPVTTPEPRWSWGVAQPPSPA